MKKMQTKENNFEIKNDIIEGRNAVVEALRVGRSIDKIFIAKGETDKTLGHIASKAREAGIVVVDADRRKLDNMSVTKAHQGVIALVGVNEYCEVSDILELARERGEQPFIIVCDEVSDPRNLGAIIRSAECAGAHGVIIPKRRSAWLTAIVGKASAGAAEHMKIARVPNIPSVLKELKDEGAYLRRGSRRQQRALEHGFHRLLRDRYRLRGRRYGQARARKLRLYREHPHGRQDKLSERFRRRLNNHVRSPAPAQRLTEVNL